jgi:uncharacterized protein (DUF2336 family)
LAGVGIAPLLRPVARPQGTTPLPVRMRDRDGTMTDDRPTDDLFVTKQMGSTRPTIARHAQERAASYFNVRLEEVHVLPFTATDQGEGMMAKATVTCRLTRDGD